MPNFCCVPWKMFRVNSSAWKITRRWYDFVFNVVAKSRTFGWSEWCNSYPHKVDFIGRLVTSSPEQNLSNILYVEQTVALVMHPDSRPRDTIPQHTTNVSLTINKTIYIAFQLPPRLAFSLLAQGKAGFRSVSSKYINRHPKQPQHQAKWPAMTG